MKILVLAQSAGVGGVESSLVNFVTYLTEQSHKVTVVFWRDEGPVRAALPIQVRVLDVQTGIARRIYRTGGLRAALAAPGASGKVSSVAYVGLRKLLRRFRNPWILLNRIPEAFDVAIAYRHEGYGPYYLVDKVNAARKIMWYHHGDYSPSPMGYSVDRRYFGRMDAIVAVSETASTLLAQRFPQLAGRLRVIHNIIDEETIRARAALPVPDPLSVDGLTLVTVSRLSEEKGVDLAARTAEVLKTRGRHFRWFVIGDGPERGKVEAFVHETGLNGRFILLGERSNPFPYMQLADLYVQTSRVEAHPLTIQEAMVLGKPIVASNIPSIEAVLDQGRLGLTSERTPEAFADAIELLADDSAKSAEYVERLALHHAPNEAASRAIDRVLVE